MAREMMTVEFHEEDMHAIAMLANYVDNKQGFEFDAREIEHAVERVNKFWNEMHWQKKVAK
jgi:hypothetical protein